ncbi:hypothetical protein KGF57_002606 [Candida theae]|uniref:RRM domain-containing protein n=1 Tax=Candida theae TaxID=1198502 RepID=A0AAD5BEK7_9ASCO|nr:uncharacterized protein KGF57_002606 [Candida theae]KAI5958251.1 hypothetical protein KGF57_002606 [Candida theae]
MTDDSSKYPPDIQKLFQPKPPLVYIPPIDYPPEERSTLPITPISNYKSHVKDYLEHELPKRESLTEKPELSQHKKKLLKANDKRQKQKDSFDRQLRDWNDPELLAKHEAEIMKDPYKTVFVARLDYSLKEIDLSNYFRKFGVIESVSIIRDHEKRSKGYGFIVYERDIDAQACVSELSRTGVKLKERTILVDIERSRVWRNWKPRRLGGGLGGRGYSKEGRVASAAASGRRLHIANNSSVPPHFPPSNVHKHNPPAYISPAHAYTPPANVPSPSKYQPISQPKPYSYNSTQTSSGRSIRSIRGGE